MAECSWCGEQVEMSTITVKGVTLNVTMCVDCLKELAACIEHQSRSGEGGE